MHECLHPDCQETLPRSLLACRAHWYALPADLRREINAAWRVVERSAPNAERLTALRRYRGLRDAAIQSWTERAAPAPPSEREQREDVYGVSMQL